MALLQYAELRKMDIVRTYSDHGKSGLDLKKRSGLKQLLLDALSPDVAYNAVLVYDVSRWGRFQNPDQGAAYEYALTAANVPVHYCAEQFANDGSLSSSLLKSLKRGMAGEYSRELSVKVWEGQRRLVQLGFRLGGIPGYGLRRHLIDQNGTFKQALSFGDRKSLQSDRVILVPGPQKEVRTVRKIYEWFTKGLLTEKLIAERLNAQGIAWVGQRPWSAKNVREILANPKYIGSSVYNRKSFKLNKEVVYNPPEEWICCPSAFRPLVTVKQFEAARTLLSSRSRIISTEDLVEQLKALLKERGYLSSGLIESSNGMSAVDTYRKRFGNLRKAYAIVQFRSEENTQFAETDAVVRRVRKATEQLISEQAMRNGASLRYRTNGRTSSLTLNEEYSIRVIPVRCSQSRASGARWYIQLLSDRTTDFTVVVRLDQANRGVLDYFIFPQGVILTRSLMLAVHNPLNLDIFRFPNLGLLEQLTARKRISEIETRYEYTFPRRWKAAGRLSERRSQDAGWKTLHSQNQSKEPRYVSIYRQSFKKQIELLSSAESLGWRALALACSLSALFADEDFRTVLRAESILDAPDFSLARELLTSSRTEIEVRNTLRVGTAPISLKQLSDSLPIDRDLTGDVRKASKLCIRALALLETYPVSESALSLLVRVKPTRQIEIAEQIVSHADWSPGFVRVLLYATRPQFLIDGIGLRKNRDWSTTASHEFGDKSELLLMKLRRLGSDLGLSFLIFAVFQQYVASILKSENVKGYVERRHPEAWAAIRQATPRIDNEFGQHPS